ncbi:hypothetical protein EMIHUDRAFT_465193 [Emiliania huxleyi CCMP1516]|uniref:ACB domain-containing protein n=4 Tax=Emiliania huxleyi TaxID=2903 RepID=A0A0D3IH97_EMIH1|nr:hypothetical protein EMIHUDRAFT_465193 [Emiliania huxleyi CCMP1516]EOD10632.1 hypothetical protein EMIHUDRAFT_465193 [Emiliania huxleyi CCMP1516]|eukprot:XP_005763061.1 hypothetical protein EMIHUDRAFT_465193 [Emiliania huxleyi CCMP1516]
MRGSGASDAPVLGFPEKFDLALRYGEELVHGNDAIDVSDRLLLDALAKQAQHGACNAPRPSLFDAEGRARYSAWCQLGNTSKMEAMFMYTRALEELAPEWWRWPPLELVPPATNEARADGECGEAGADTAAPNGTAGAEAVPPAAANHPNSTEPPPVPNGAVTPTAHPAHPAHVAPPSATPLASEPEHPPGGAPPSALRRLTVGGWTRLAEQGAPARYRHACVVVGARLLVYGGRANSGRLAASICVLDLLSGVWSEPTIGGAAPEQRWGHTMCAYRGLAIVFGGHRGRGSLCDTPVLDTQSMAWASPSLPGPPPPPRGTHAAAVCADRLWVMGGDSPAAGALQMDVWSLPLRGLAEACSTRADAARGWEVADTSGGVPPPCRDGTACACGPRVLLIGGAGPSGYAPMASLWLLHVEELSWSAVHTSGSVPRPRAGHCSATAAQAALTHGFTELQVVAVPAAGDGGPAGAAAAASATSQEQALSMMLQRLEELQLQWRNLEGGTTSLLSQAC